MAKVTLKHKLPCGAIETRTTARTYSHVVVMRRDLSVIREQEGRISKLDLSNYEFFKAALAAGVGGSQRLQGGLDIKVDQARYDRAVIEIGDCKSAQAYAEKRRDARLAAHDAKHGNAKFGDWFVAGWCGRADLAEKLAQKERKGWAPADVRVEAINNGE